MTIFNEHDLRYIITSLVQDARNRGGKLTFERLARAARVQKAHITNVLKGRASFQSDQLFLICKELLLSREETQYLLLLLEHERSSVSERKKELWKEIERLQAEHLQTEKYLQPEIDDTPLEKRFPSYYLDPIHQIIHIAVSIEQFSQNPKSLASILGVSGSRITSVLAALEAHGVIAQKNGHWVSMKKHVHLKRSSVFYPAWKLQMQNLGQARSQATHHDKSYGFTAVFSADEKTRKKIQAKLLEFIQEVEPLVVQAPSQEVYQLSLDLLSWTGKT